MVGRVTGIRELQVNIKNINKALPGEIKKALKQSGKIVVKKSKDIVPVKTGALKKSIKSRLQGGKKVVIGSDLVYAPFIELGTRFMRAQPYLRPALSRSKRQVRDVFCCGCE